MAKYDYSILCRNCTSEITAPLKCSVTGSIPSWVVGKVVYNGPGMNKIGDQEYNHAFDGAALLQKFNIGANGVDYTCKFVKSAVYGENREAGFITRPEFGTAAESKGLFSRLKNAVDPDKMFSDNTQLSVCKFGNDYYTLGEIPFMIKVDINTLETSDIINLNKTHGLMTVSPHPITDKDGSIYTIGQAVGLTGPKYNVIRFTPGEEIKKGKVMCSISSRWKMSPCYIHSMGMTDNYVVVLEQPLAVSVSELMSDIIKNVPFIQALKWHDEVTIIHVIDKNTWQEVSTKYVTNQLFMLHFSNIYEEDGHIVFDIPVYKDSTILERMYIKTLRGDIGDVAYDTFAESFVSRMTRFVIPLKTDGEGNLVKLSGTKCAATKTKKEVKLDGDQLLDLASENPVINPKYIGKKHSFIWAMGPHPSHGDGGHMTKINVATGDHTEFREQGLYTSQPIFIPNPNGKGEDDGIVMAMILKSEDKKFVGLVLLDAKTMTEVARIMANTDADKPMPLHGSFFN